MVPGKQEKMTSNSENINNAEKNNNIPFPKQIDKEPSKSQNNTINNYNINQLKYIQEINQQNINNYKKGDKCELVYSEEEYEGENKYISYDKLVELVNIEEPYKKNNYKNFTYKNYNPNNELLFSSEFESGNLRYAIKLNSNEYDLILRPETDCIRTYHWFFFRVKINELSTSDKLKDNKIIKFNIINLYKKTVLFSEKIKVLCYYNNAWSRDTFDIHYFINGIPFLIDFRNNNNNHNNSVNLDINNSKSTNDYSSSKDLNDSNNIANTSRNNSNIDINYNNNNNIIINDNNNNINNVNNVNNNNNNNININNNYNNNQEDMKYHTLTFSFDLSKITTDQKYIYFAYCYPYTYTQLDSYLSSLKDYKDILRFDEIGKSLEGNSLHMLIITNFNDSFDELANKKAVIFTGRVHPGESNSSYVIQGVIEFLLSNDPAAKNLRKNFIFKIVPMLNPDGVIRGNFRMNLLGKDLNRMWEEPHKNVCPTIYNVIKMILKTLDSRDIYFFCDFHGHSNKHNFFLYSCQSKYDYLQLDEQTIIPNPQKSKLTFYELVFQFILNKENTFLDRFSCTNKINATKTKTSRAILKTKYDVDFSYCLETSIGGMKTRDGTVIPYTINLYKKIGKDFCISLNKLIEPKIFFSILSTIRFSKNEKCSLYSKNKYKGKLVYLPYINNMINNSKNNLDYSNNESENKTKSKKKNKKNKNINNKINNTNEKNNYFQKLNTSNYIMNSKGINLAKKTSNGISYSFSCTKDKDDAKNNNLKYNSKLRRSSKIEKKY